MDESDQPVPSPGRRQGVPEILDQLDRLLEMRAADRYAWVGWGRDGVPTGTAGGETGGGTQRQHGVNPSRGEVAQRVWHSLRPSTKRCRSRSECGSQLSARSGRSQWTAFG